MKLSISIPDDEVEFLDYYVKLHDLSSRSAGLHEAVRALRDLDLQDEYEQAFSEEERYEDPAILEQWHELAEVARRRRQQPTDATW